MERLRNSKNLVLITSADTRLDRDWVPFEIEYAVDTCRMPLIIAYTGVSRRVTRPADYATLWPAALATRIKNGSAHAIHVPFLEKPIAAAVRQLHVGNYPAGGGLGWYDNSAYNGWGIA